MQGLDATHKAEVENLRKRLTDADAKVSELESKASEERRTLQRQLDDQVAKHNKDKSEQRAKCKDICCE
jgi:hypothetical protein